ncbi:hypothetical protein EVAR_19468_1 [Eumeta japonica]|uniref:Uncharacterized protein n=1 Tax=Eumeta variegata TaxID=151549 RepID=A0A4C1V8N9_EUMVA|nr:hypothetical protein EVAR_19468_1 [Eumeta japonica]
MKTRPPELSITIRNETTEAAISHEREVALEIHYVRVRYLARRKLTETRFLTFELASPSRAADVVSATPARRRRVRRIRSGGICPPALSELELELVAELELKAGR